MILDDIKSRPSDIIQIPEDTDAAAVFLELGWMEKTREHIKSNPKGTIVLTHSGHVTHWIIGAHFSGCLDAKDDGYMITALPKCDYSTSQANEEVRRLVEREGGQMSRFTRFRKPDQFNN
jgi:hypothetical protein